MSCAPAYINHTELIYLYISALYKRAGWLDCIRSGSVQVHCRFSHTHTRTFGECRVVCKHILSHLGQKREIKRERERERERGGARGGRHMMDSLSPPPPPPRLSPPGIMAGLYKAELCLLCPVPQLRSLSQAHFQLRETRLDSQTPDSLFGLSPAELDPEPGRT